MTREFFVSIPRLLEVKEVDQWQRVFELCYDDEKNNNTLCFARDKNRFYLFDCMKVPLINIFKKFYLKKVLLMANELHKIDKLSTIGQIKLKDQASVLNSKMKSIDTNEVLASTNAGW
jgi:hypothetical protein